MCYNRYMIGGLKMNNSIISLRQFINDNDKFENVHIQTFCRLMKKVSEALDKETRNIVSINLDDIKINTQTGDIVFPDNLFVENIDTTKTITGFNTGISLMADRKSTKENKRVSLALVILGWYANQDGSAVISDIEVLENFDYYMSKVPSWLQDYFIGVFRRMDYETSFADYYKVNFTDKVKNDITNTFKEYNLSDEQMKNIIKIVMRHAENMTVRGEING